MYAVAEMKARDALPREDHSVSIRGATWADYERLLELRGEKAVPRLTYLEGILEIMSPSDDHESVKSYIGRLVEAYCLDRGVRFRPVGAWTLKDRERERGLEPDECYVLGTPLVRPTRPDLAIEVVWTSGGLDKLEVYRGLGVGEVWYWRGGEIEVYLLRGDRYERAERSACLRDLDLALLVTFLDRPTAYDAIMDFRAALAHAKEDARTRPSQPAEEGTAGRS
jgi:Uma2 family endonuclease